MNSTMNLLLRAAIAAAATDREKFVNQVSSLIEKQGASPESAEKIAGNIDILVEMLDQKLFLDQLTGKTADTSDLEKKIDRLADSMDELNHNIAKLLRK